MKNVISILTRVIVMVLASYAYIANNVYCENLFVFFTWAGFLLALLTLVFNDNDTVKNGIKIQTDGEDGFRSAISIMFTLILAVFLIAVGHWFLAILWSLVPFIWTTTKRIVMEGR